jgi:amino acid permease
MPNRDVYNITSTSVQNSIKKATKKIPVQIYRESKFWLAFIKVHILFGLQLSLISILLHQSIE